MESPGPTDAPAPEETALSTGAGVEEASHPSTTTPDEGVGASVKPQTPKTVDGKIFERDVQPCEDSRVLMKGCSRKQLAGCACEEELDKFVLLEDG